MGKRRELEFRRELAGFVRTGTTDVLKIEKLYDRLIAATSDLERGQWLVEIRSILELSGTFGRFLHSLPLFALRSAYRYINGFENCQREFPAAVLKEAMEMDLPMYGGVKAPFGRFTAAIKATPPPKNPSPKTARMWLEGIDDATPRRRAFLSWRTDPDAVMEMIYRVVARRSKWPQLTPREQKTFGVKLIGLLMTHFGLERGTYSPVTIPESYTGHSEAIGNIAEGRRTGRARTRVA
jgi:hypothetical protein